MSSSHRLPSSSRSSRNAGSSSNAASSSSAERRPRWDDGDLKRFKLIERGDGPPRVEAILRTEGHVIIKDICELPVYKAYYEDNGAYHHEEAIYRAEFYHIFQAMVYSKITLRGGFDCAAKLLGISNPRASLSARTGFFFCNTSEDTPSFGTIGTRTGVTMIALQVHIESQRKDRSGKVINALTLRRKVLYLLRGPDDDGRLSEPRYHREMTTFKLPRADVDRMLMCDMYNYPRTNHLTVTRETIHGRLMSSQMDVEKFSFCDECCAKIGSALYYENCHNKDCSICIVWEGHGPTCQIVSNDLLFAGFEKVTVRGVEIWDRWYNCVLEATRTVAKLRGGAEPQDFVAEILKESQVSPTTFLKVAAVSQKMRSYFSTENTCYMLAPGKRGELVQSKPLSVSLDVRMLATEIDGEYVDRVNMNFFSLKEKESGLFRLSPAKEAYSGPTLLGEVKLGG